VARHFLSIFMAAGAQLYDFGLGAAPPHAMSKMSVKIFGPVLLGVAADTPGQGFPGQGFASAPHAFRGGVHAIRVTVFAGGQILGIRFGIFGRPGPMDAGLKFFDHVDVGKLLIGGRFFYMAFGGTINLLDIRVRNFIETDMTILAFQFAMNGSGKFFAIDIKNPFDAALIESSHTGIAMAQQTVFRIRNGIGSRSRAGRQNQKKNAPEAGY
jgi:hypothetical protein